MTSDKIQALRRSYSSLDVIADCFQTTNSKMSTLLYQGKTLAFSKELYWIKSNSPGMQQRYIETGSFYPSLLTCLKGKEYQKILDGLKEAEGFPQFFTPRIRLCQALCYLQLKNIDASIDVLSNLHDEADIPYALYSLIEESIPSIAEQYSELQSYYNTLVIY